RSVSTAESTLGLRGRPANRAGNRRAPSLSVRMTTHPQKRTIVHALDGALRDTLGLHHKSTLDEFFGPGPFGRYLRDRDLRMAQHFDLAPAFLILDPLLGSLGIVEATLPMGVSKDEDVGALVRRHIDTATYVRHLLLRDKLLAGRKALTVELVLLTADETSEEKKFLEEIGTALRQVLRDTDSLFHIGVSVLCAAGGSEPFKGRRRRAFPWLLNATREWLSSPDATQGKRGANPGRRLRRLTLNNYRLPGTREIVFSNAQVHLIHGPNGSGKS